MLPRIPMLAPAFLPVIVTQGALLVTSRTTDEVLRYDGATGAFLDVFAAGGGLDNPVGLTFGADGHLYVASGDSDQVLRYDGATGAFLDVFAAGPELDGPRQVNFGPDGHLYVSSGPDDVVLRYDGRSGAFLGVFAAGGGLNGPTSFTFGPSGDLFVGSVLNDRVKRYDGASGAFLGNFATQRLDGPHDLAFGPDGHLYVSNAFATTIVRFDGQSGAFLDVFVNDPALSAALGLSWDDEGRLIVVNQVRNEVRRYDGVSGALLDVLVAPGSGGLASPLFATFEPRSNFVLDGPRPGLVARSNLVVLSGAAPGARLWLGVGEHVSAWLPPACPRPLGLPGGFLTMTLIADESGRAHLGAFVPRSFAGRRFYLRALEPSRCTASSWGLVRF